MADREVLWQPSEERVKRSQMHAFMRAMAEKYGFAAEWAALHRWSVEHRDQFWGEMLILAEIEAFAPAEAVCRGEEMFGIKGLLPGQSVRESARAEARGSGTCGKGTEWFPGMKLNYAAHLLRHDDDRVAIEAEDELGRTRRLTYRELRAEVARCAAALKSVGVARGDRVAGFVPNIPESIIAMLAAASLGAVWSSCSPDFGINGVVDRFGQIEPKVLFAADAYSYNGKTIDSLQRVREVLTKISSIERVVVVPFMAEAPDISSLSIGALWGDFLDGGIASRRAGKACGSWSNGEVTIEFESVPFDHPLFIMYSSGTTGVPKCIVHGHGGTLLQHMKELTLHCDLRRDDTIFYFTTCGWMMWNWVVSSLGVGATVVLYEGGPAHPDMNHLWQMAERLGITVFGTSPKYLAACEKSALKPGVEQDLSKLRCVLSTGAPLTVENFRWVYANLKEDLQLSSISGGTDLISCFMLGNPILPVRAGEIQCLGLGMDVHAYDETGRSVQGEKGELVCISPFPSQPVGFWNDPDGEKYRQAYFDHFPGVWRHGDFVELTESGGVIVYGRSDTTLNPGGVRIGTAEIYRQVEAMDEVADSIVIGRDVVGDVEVCLFVVLVPGLKLDEQLARAIRRRIMEGATPRHVPRHIHQVPAVPYTISGKKVELAVAQTVRGQAVRNIDALANPESLAAYTNITWST
ncbi:MAG: acetoacetate--CoA ligase [Planctomycetes bacterium]|nr:acetoacetate--CoA ligase [Planctomycetota bacterium]